MGACKTAAHASYPSSIFIRSANDRGRWPLPGDRMSTLLQHISVFLKDYLDGLYPDYWTLVNTRFISLSPRREGEKI